MLASWPARQLTFFSNDLVLYCLRTCCTGAASLGYQLRYNYRNRPARCRHFGGGRYPECAYYCYPASH
jgi:hypothetical protein